MKKDPICKDFAEQAILTWTKLMNSDETKLSFDEESITDLNLQDLQIKNSYQIQTFKFNKQVEEPLNGADWEWWLTSGNRGLGLRIQAKKLNLNTLLYPSVNKSKWKTNRFINSRCISPDSKINTTLCFLQFC